MFFLFLLVVLKILVEQGRDYPSSDNYQSE